MHRTASFPVSVLFSYTDFLPSPYHLFLLLTFLNINIFCITISSFKRLLSITSISSVSSIRTPHIQIRTNHNDILSSYQNRLGMYCMGIHQLIYRRTCSKDIFFLVQIIRTSPWIRTFFHCIEYNLKICLFRYLLYSF